jgi:hypothetical protein
MSEQQPPSPSHEGKVMATQDDIDTKQEELDAELKEVRFVCRGENTVRSSGHCGFSWLDHTTVP